MTTGDATPTPPTGTEMIHMTTFTGAVLVREDNGAYEIIDPIADVAGEFAAQEIEVLGELTGWGYEVVVRGTDEHGETRWYFANRA